MKRKILVLLFILITILPAFSVTAYIKGAYLFGVDTNIFSNPLPVNMTNDPIYDANGTHIGYQPYSTWLTYRMETAPYLFKLSNGFTTSADIFFSKDGKTGLSASVHYGIPFKAEETRPSSNNAFSNWTYESKEALGDQKNALFFGVGPIFRAKFSFLDLGLSLRMSIGTYDTFADNVIVGLQAEPFLNFHFTDYTYFTLGMTYDAHLMKFLPTDENRYFEEHYFMLTLAPYVGIGIRIGER